MLAPEQIVTHGRCRFHMPAHTFTDDVMSLGPSCICRLTTVAL